MTQGIIVPRTLTVDYLGDAILECEALATYDGTNNPVQTSDSSALPSAVTDAERFTIGSVTVESIAMTQVKNLTINFGLDVRLEGGNDDLWPTYAYVQNYQPTITIRGTDLKVLDNDGGTQSTVPLIGQAITDANTSIYLKKRASGSTYVANATTEHILFNATGMAYIDSAIDGSSNDPSEIVIMIESQYDGSNLPIVIDTSIAHPA